MGKTARDRIAVNTTLDGNSNSFGGEIGHRTSTEAEIDSVRLIKSNHNRLTS